MKYSVNKRTARKLIWRMEENDNCVKLSKRKMNFGKIKKELIVCSANSRERMRISRKKKSFFLSLSILLNRAGEKNYFCIHGNFVLGRNRDISNLTTQNSVPRKEARSCT